MALRAHQPLTLALCGGMMGNAFACIAANELSLSVPRCYPGR
ncbi:hypothetical protein REJC140_03583 [Pseudorhizobium endolithicum]|uniref:Uncharacterized protein n=1 Tax=Pseudorhizobium endolithicum TaxID=1191678 RepID=A0ABM8PLQ1_9HYPH|nr:hypothetical protein REQ54_03932 [Rhizobium sp. Q54]CAD7036822.1 hypothetical protein REJC140_03583 [Pseudorhizobium endolithicum]